MKIVQIEMDSMGLDDLKELFKKKMAERAVKSAPMHRRKEMHETIEDMEEELGVEDPYEDDAELHASKAEVSGLPPEVAKAMKSKPKPDKKRLPKNGKKED